MKALASLLPLGNSAVLLQHSHAAKTRLLQEWLTEQTICVVGGGALGNEVLKNLGLLGARQVVVVDPDKVEISNISRSVFFRASDCGRPKAATLCVSLTSAFPGTQWRSCDSEIADVGYGELDSASVVFTCVDSDLARVEAAWLAMCLDIPMVDAGLGGPDSWQGRVSVFPGRQSACFGCKLSPRRRRDLLSLALSTSHSCWQNGEATRSSSTPTMASLIGALQVEFGLQCLAEFGSHTTNDLQSPTIEVSLGLTPSLRRFVTPVSQVCPFHDAAPQQCVPLPYSQATARELLGSQGGDKVDLDWPICVAACCLDCRSEWHPMRRVAWLRRHGSCPHCGNRRILEKETVCTLDRNSILADVPLVELGLPPNHLYAIRRKGERQ